MVLVKHLLFIAEKESVTTKILFKLSSTGVKEKKQADEVLFCF